MQYTEIDNTHCMAFTPEIKNFAKNTLILTMILSVVIHLSWNTLASWMGMSTSASYNNANFERSDIMYVGNIATALSLNLG